MALRGALKDHGIADIFQLLSQQRKSGVLIVNSDGSGVRICFLNGEVVWAGPSERDRREHLGIRLVRAEIITEEQLHIALEAQRSVTLRLGEILIQRFGVSSEDVARCVELQTTEPLYKVFRWKHGEYSFEPSSDIVAGGDRTPMKVDRVLMEAFRRMDAWSVVDKRLSDRSKKIQTKMGVNPRLDDPAQQRVLEVMRGSLSIQTIYNRSLLGELDCYTAILDLLDSGVVEWAPDDDTKVYSERLELRRVTAAVSSSSTPLFWLLLSCAMLILAYLVVPYHPSTVTKKEWVEHALSAHQQMFGNYPEQLDQDLEQFLPASAQPSHSDEVVWKNFRYLKIGKSYRLAPAGSTILPESKEATQAVDKGI